MFVTYKKSLWFHDSTSPSYEVNLFLLSYVLLKTFKTESNVVPVLLFLKEVHHGFTLICKKCQGIEKLVLSDTQSVALPPRTEVALSVPVCCYICQCILIISYPVRKM